MAKQTYEYAKADGGMGTIEADSPEAAISSASDRAATSGVALAARPTPTPNTSSSSPSTTPERPITTPTPSGSTEKPVIRHRKISDSQDPNSYSNVYKELAQSAQGEINSLKSFENDLLAEQRVINETNDRSTNAVSTLTGLAGSTEANAQQQKTTKAGQAANKAIQSEIEMKVQGIMSNVRATAIAESRARRTEDREDEAARIANRKAAKEEAVSNLMNLTSAGVTFEGLKNSDPESFNYLAETFGGEDGLKGAFILNTPQDQILDKQIVGGNYIIAKQNPITGKITTEVLNLGIPPQYNKSVDLGGQIMFYDETDPTKQMFVNKSLTPEEQMKSTSGISPDSPYAGVINTIIGSGKFTEAQKATIANAIANGEDPATVIKNQAKGLMSSAEATDVAGFETARDQVKSIDSLLKDYYAKGGDTGLLKGNFEKVINKLGNVADPELVSIATNIQAALQVYRNAVSGTAYSVQEGADIASIFPGINKSEGLNQAVINGRLQAFDTTIDSKYKNAIGEKAYNQIKELENKPKTLQEYYNRSDNDAQQIEQIKTQYPELSDEEVMQVLEGGGGGFSSVGNTSASLNVPQRNKNPGNIKQGGLADDLAVGVDEQGHLIFPDEKTGFLAMQKDIEAKVNGNSQWLPKNPTIAQLGSVYAEDPNWPKSVAKILGVDVNTPTQKVPLAALTRAIAQQEGYFA